MKESGTKPQSETAQTDKATGQHVDLNTQGTVNKTQSNHRRQEQNEGGQREAGRRGAGGLQNNTEHSKLKTQKLEPQTHDIHKPKSSV